MALEVFEDEMSDGPHRERRVSFATSDGPLTPHHKNTTKRRSKTRQNSSKNNGAASQKLASTTMQQQQQGSKGKTSLRRQLRATTNVQQQQHHRDKENRTVSFRQQQQQDRTSHQQQQEKENAPSGLSLRRQLRATMMPSSSSPTTSKQEETNRSNNVFTPHNAKRRKSLLKTPKTMLNHELEFADADESLLVSPSLSIVETKSPFPTKVDRLETALEESAIADDHVPPQQKSSIGSLKSANVDDAMEESVAATVPPLKSVSVVDNEVEGSATVDVPQLKSPSKLDSKADQVEVKTGPDTVTMKEPSVNVAVGKSQVRERLEKRELRRKRSQKQAVSTETKKTTGTTPYRLRGNGARLDLSSMFTEVVSPQKEQVKASGQATVEQPVEQSTKLSAMPVASLDNLRESLFLDFDDEKKNVVGTTRSMAFVLEAPAENGCVVCVERVPVKKGFELVLDDEHCAARQAESESSGKPMTLRLHAGDRIVMKVLWTPVEAGGVREVILLKLPRGRLCITVRGKARSVQAKKTANGRKARLLQRRHTAAPKNLTKPTTKRVEVAPVPVSKSGSVIARSAPSASVVNAVQSAKAVGPQDTNWADKQCEAFACWLNYTFNPSEDKDHEASLLECAKGEAGDATGMDRAAHRTLLLHRRMAQVRGKATELFHSHDLQVVQGTINAEVAKGQLKLRKDRDMYSDLTLRGQITSLLLSYSTPWLRLGLETIFGEVIAPETPSHFSPQRETMHTAGSLRKAEKVPLSRMKLTLKNFIVNRVLSDPATLEKYTHGRCKVPSGNFEKKFRMEMRILTLRRLLLLIIFLDRAKEANILERTPRLFATNAKVKSSQAVLIALCRDFLSSEGNIIKHLSRIDIKVSYKQTAIDEIDYTVKNLATDIRDGVRLGRMTEILTGREPKSILCTLRLPAVSRLQKLHNVGTVLEILRNCGVPDLGEVVPHHIVDGHREILLKLMWSVLAHCGLQTLLDAESVETEIQSVCRANAIRRPRWKLGLGRVEEDVFVPDVHSQSNQVDIYKSLLLLWCNAVCLRFGRSVSDFTTSFADGTVLCLLIHYYHPGLLPLNAILSTTRHLSEEECKIDEKYRQALHREAQNFELAQAAISDLGGIPKMIPTADSDNVPEEKSMFLSVAYLCSRLMESSRENLACIAIQNCYRYYRRLVDLKRKIAGASIILKYWRENKEQYYANQCRRYKAPILIIEEFLYSVKDQLLEMKRKRLLAEKQTKAAILIQSHTRRVHCARKVLPVLKRNQAARKIQTQWRRFDAMIELELMLVDQESATVIQKYWRGARQRMSYVHKIECIVGLQSCARGLLVRNELIRRNEAAVSLQRIWRAFWAQVQTQLAFMDIVTVQSIARRKLALLEHSRRKCAVIILQQHARRFRAVRIINQLRVARNELNRRLDAAVTCQCFFRRCKAVRDVRKALRENLSTTAIQVCWRGSKARASFRTIKSSAIGIQAVFRGSRTRHEMDMQRISAVYIQTAWRGLLARAQFVMDRHDVVLVQSVIRRFIAKRHAVTKQAAATIIGCNWRAHVACSLYNQKRAVCVSVQAAYRGLVVRREIQFLSACASVLQAKWRCYWAKLNYQLDLFDIIIVQSMFRRRVAIDQHKQRTRALLSLQAFGKMCCAKLEARRLHLETVEHQQRQVASVSLQSVVRAYLATKHFKKQRQRIIACQAYARRQLVQQDLVSRTSSATLIQKIWRGFVASVVFAVTRSDVITIQAVVRRSIAQSLCDKRIRLVCSVQNAARCWLASRRVAVMRAERLEQLRLEAARRTYGAILFQAAFRGYVVRRELRVLARHTTAIQRITRGYLAYLAYELDRLDIIIVQSLVRGWSSRRMKARQIQSTLRIQTAVRAWLARQEVEHLRRLQRELEQELRVMHQSARTIQKTWRCFIVHVDFMLLIISCITIQTVVRQHQAKTKRRKAFRGIKRLQAVARGASGRAFQQRLATCATTIQAQVRTFIAESNFEYHLWAAVQIQRVARGFITRSEMDLRNFVACEIQRIWRGYQRNVEFIMKVISAIKIQSVCRSTFAKRTLRDIRRQRFLETVKMRFQGKKASAIQRVFRAHMLLHRQVRAAYCLQAIARGYVCRSRVGRMQTGIVTLQSRARGYVARRRRSKKARVIAKRLETANHHAQKNPNMRLGVRTAAALGVIQKSTRLGEIINAVSTLETSTRLSRKCCVAFTSCDAPEIIYKLVRECNRSLPHIEVLHYVLLTLKNVASHDDLLLRLASRDSADLFMDLLQNCRGRENVFCLAVALLYMVITKNKDLMPHCATRENLNRLKGVHRISSRKVSGASTRVTRSMASNGPRSSVRSRGSGAPMDLKQGLKRLQRIISLLESM